MLERRFVETNFRTLEIDQSFSLMQIDPAALLRLRETGECQFTIAEFYCDLFYPGHYRRKIKSVRVTIPCITGPFTNVSATLRLQKSFVRKDPKLGAAQLLELPPRRSVSIATSTAQNDGGVFEMSFRDERYMPFEGAGVVSQWHLSLPRAFRHFDYQTINDAIISINYTALEDGVLREQVELQNAATEGTLLNFASTAALQRLFSLRQDFSAAFQRLLFSPAGTQVSIDIGERYLPMFLKGRAITVTKALLAVKTAAGQTTTGLQVSIDGTVQSVFTASSQLGGLPAADLGTLFAAGLLGTHTWTVVNAGPLAPTPVAPGDTAALDAAKLLDLVLYVEYSVQT